MCMVPEDSMQPEHNLKHVDSKLGKWLDSGANKVSWEDEMSSSHWIMEVSFTTDGRREEVLKDRSFVGRSPRGWWWWHGYISLGMINKWIGPDTGGHIFTLTLPIQRRVSWVRLQLSTGCTHVMEWAKHQTLCKVAGYLLWRRQRKGMFRNKFECLHRNVQVYFISHTNLCWGCIWEKL